MQVGPKSNDRCPYMETEERRRGEEMAMWRQGHRLQWCRRKLVLWFFSSQRLLLPTCWNFFAFLQYLSLFLELFLKPFLFLHFKKFPASPLCFSFKKITFCKDSSCILTSLLLISEMIFILLLILSRVLSSHLEGFLILIDVFAPRFISFSYLLAHLEVSTVLNCSNGMLFWHTFFRDAILLLLFLYLIKTLCGIWPHYFSVAHFHL